MPKLDKPLAEYTPEELKKYQAELIHSAKVKEIEELERANANAENTKDKKEKHEDSTDDDPEVSIEDQALKILEEADKK